MLFADYLKLCLKPLLNYPDSLEVFSVHDQMGILLSVKLDKRDMGIVIGKQGDTAKAFRTLLRVFGAQNQARVSVKFLEPEGGLRSNYQGTSDLK